MRVKKSTIALEKRGRIVRNLKSPALAAIGGTTNGNEKQGHEVTEPGLGQVERIGESHKEEGGVERRSPALRLRKGGGAPTLEDSSALLNRKGHLPVSSYDQIGEDRLRTKESRRG